MPFNRVVIVGLGLMGGSLWCPQIARAYPTRYLKALFEAREAVLVVTVSSERRVTALDHTHQPPTDIAHVEYTGSGGRCLEGSG